MSHCLITSSFAIALVAANIAGCYAAEPTPEAAWKPHVVRQLNGQAGEIELPAQLQIMTEKWDRLAKAPYMPQGYSPFLIYMPERKRVLMQFDSGLNPTKANIITSDDGADTWSDPRYITTDQEGKVLMGATLGLTYLGQGRMLCNELTSGWAPLGISFSNDYGETWGNRISYLTLSDGRVWNKWDTMLVDRDPKSGNVLRLVQTGYDYVDAEGKGYPGAFLRSSTDEGRTWTSEIKVPEWKGTNEVALVRARNGDIVAACRTVLPERFAKGGAIDHYEGLVYSISKDNGQRWSKLKRLYEWGRHHPSMVLMPGGGLVMTYVVRKGYVDTEDGYPQFGVEAIVSHDHGETWDLDHRYLLATWKGAYKSATKGGWYPSPQNTSSILLPSGSVLTAFSTGELSDEKQTRRDVAFVRWRLNNEAVNSDRTIRNAPFDSDIRNVFDPAVP